MAILRMRDGEGRVHGIRALKGEAGAGVHVGRYVGNADPDDNTWRRIDLGSPHVRAVFLADSDAAFLPATLVTAEGTDYNYVEIARLVAADDGVMQLEVSGKANWKDVVYHYVTFIEEAAE